MSAAIGGISGVDGEEEIGGGREAADLSVLLRRCWRPSAEGKEDVVDGAAVWAPLGEETEGRSSGLC